MEVLLTEVDGCEVTGVVDLESAVAEGVAVEGVNGVDGVVGGVRVDLVQVDVKVEESEGDALVWSLWSVPKCSRARTGPRIVHQPEEMASMRERET